MSALPRFVRENSLTLAFGGGFLQSEFLQFFLYVFGTVWLLQRGSPESKPVGSPHASTGVEG
ncbi:hypothetical protein J7E91_34465 [Streptomyces sp. ISL-99]|nr:DUF6766 family protein [Streptomyces sp. ISL-99]MBT2530319.1 hypothetical protein [Streptomyces sp. ISL-99]